MCVYICINTYVNTYVSNIYTAPTDLYKIWSITKPSRHNKNTQQLNLSPLTPPKKSAPGSASCRSDRGRSFPSAVSGNNATWDKSWNDEVWKPHQNPPPPNICISMVPTWKIPIFQAEFTMNLRKFQETTQFELTGVQASFGWSLGDSNWRVEASRCIFKGSCP